MSITGGPPNARQAIGGFFERHIPDDCAGGPSLLDAWTEGREYAAFINARSAFAALAAKWPEARIWLPAFICRELAEAVKTRDIRFYPVRNDFGAELGPVDRDSAPGDLVLLVAQFGLPLSKETRAFVKRRTDLHFIDDRSQALDAGSVCGWALFSPRKLFGVADGGLLVAPEGQAVPRPQSASDSGDLWRAANLRLIDPSVERSPEWHRLNQAKEAALPTSDAAISPLSLELLSRTSLASLVERRRKNWELLNDSLALWSALPANPAGTPLGYVLRLHGGRRDALLSRLHDEHIFAAVHWLQLPVERMYAPREWEWTAELVTLPCDHRYGDVEMARVAEKVMEFLE